MLFTSKNLYILIHDNMSLEEKAIWERKFPIV